MLLTLIATDPKDKTKAQRTRREHWCNEREAAEMEKKYAAVGMKTERRTDK